MLKSKFSLRNVVKNVVACLAEKKLFLSSMLILLMMGGVCLNATAQTKTVYIVVSTWIYNDNGDQRPCVSNVVSYSCKYDYAGKPNSDAKSQFRDFFKAFYKRSGYSVNSGKTYADSFDTRDKAEKKRRELIADFNKNWDTFIVNDFSITCDD